MFYILDTNILSDVLKYGLDRPQGRRVDAAPRANIKITIVTFEEMLAGRLLELARDPKKVPRLEPLHVRYSLLQETFRELSRYYPPLPFDVGAQAIYDSIPAEARRKAAHDFRIAAIQVALGRDYTVISRDQKDFQLIEKTLPMVQWEDWSIVTPP